MIAPTTALVDQSISFARVLYDYASLTNNMSDYMNFDSHRQPPIFVSIGAVAETVRTLEFTRLRVLLALECAILQIGGREPQKK
jgi:hypothetical protein